MPPKKVFNREEIINAAFDILRSKGKKALSARTLAYELDSSTMPIYTTLTSMKSIEKELDRKMFDLFIDYAKSPVTGDTFTDISWGYIRFARDEKELFKLMFLDTKPRGIAAYKKNKGPIVSLLLERLSAESEFADLPETEMARIMEMNEIFIHGIASLIAAGRFENLSDEHILSLIREIREFLIRRNTLSEYIQLLKQSAKSFASKIELGE
ncbi:MAG TPA: TetR-like C-terminal domain-containing protein [Spirochaetota bacterium]